MGTMQTGRKWTNVHHFRYSAGASTPGVTELDNLDVELTRLYSGTPYTGGIAVLAHCASPLKLDQIQYTVLDGQSLTYTKAKGLTATGGTTSMPAEVAQVLTLRTAKRGRQNRGRIYLPCPSTGYTTADGNLDPTHTGLIMGQYTGMVSALNTKQWKPGVASYGFSYHKVPGSKPPQYVPATWTPHFEELVTWTMDLRPDVQRRRK